MHYPPPSGSIYDYPAAERPPLGAALAESLAGKCGFRQRFPRESARNLQRVSLEFERQHRRRSLVDEVRSQVHAGGTRQPSPVVRALAKLNFPLVVTTNYDQLFERALARAGKTPDESSHQLAFSAGDFLACPVIAAYSHSASVGNGPELPVESVSWNRVQGVS